MNRSNAEGCGQGLARPSRAALALCLLAWAGAVSAGFGVLLRYKATPGAGGQPPVQWPRESRLRAPANGRAALLMFAHPHCPCTHASISELARLSKEVPGQLDVQVVLVRPIGVGDEGLAADWNDTELQRRAASLPRASVVRDEGAREAARFNAAVSGFTVLYDGQGRLRFAGGITSSRGHEGDSFGKRRILAALSGRPADREDAPVFGCALGVKEGS